MNDTEELSRYCELEGILCGWAYHLILGIVLARFVLRVRLRVLMMSIQVSFRIAVSKTEDPPIRFVAAERSQYNKIRTGSDYTMF